MIESLLIFFVNGLIGIIILSVTVFVYFGGYDFFDVPERYLYSKSKSWFARILCYLLSGIMIVVFMYILYIVIIFLTEIRG